jgi:hypothetical protein
MMQKSVFAAACAVALLASQGCAGYRIMAAQPDRIGVAGQPFEHKSTSYFGKGGFSSDATGYVATECGERGTLADVSVERDFGQGLISFLTLGAVSPATILFYCNDPGPPPPGDDDGF